MRHNLSVYIQLLASILASFVCLGDSSGHDSTKDVEAKVNCNFDNGLCSWRHSSKDDFDWTIIHGETPTTDTGPTNDHTQGNSSGNYIFIETSAPRRLDEKAELVSPLVDTWNNNYLCFSLWFYAYGANIGGLRVRLEQSQFLNRTEVLWQNTTHGAAWKLKSVSIVPTGPFRIIIEGTVGDGYLGDIAVDDITIAEGKCPQNTSGSPSVVG